MFALILVILITFLIAVYTKIKFSYWKKRGINGPSPIPIFGTVLAENLNHNRHTEWEFYQKYGPVFGTYSGTRPFFNTASPDHIKEILSRDDVFHNKGSFSFNDKYLENSLLLRNGPDWKQARLAMSHFYTSHKLRNLMAHYEQVTNYFLSNIEEIQNETGNEVIDIRNLTSYFGIDLISKVVMAIDINSFKERDTEFVKLASSIGDVKILHFLFMTILPKYVSKLLGLNAFDAYKTDRLGDLFKQMIRKRASQGVKFNDLAEQMQQQIKEKNLDLDENTVIGNVILNFFAGVDNVSVGLSNLFLMMAEHSEIKERLYEEIKKEFSGQITYEKLMENAYLDGVFKETLRLRSSILLLKRSAMQDTTIGEFKIEKGTGINLMTGLIQVHPDFYPDPLKFDPNRFADKSSMNENRTEYFWPFGGGNKACIGMRMATLEMKYALVRVLLKYDVYKPKDFKLEEINARALNTFKSMTLGFKRRA